MRNDRTLVDLIAEIAATRRGGACWSIIRQSSSGSADGTGERRRLPASLPAVKKLAISAE
jgi:hypothetical protein